MQQSSEQREQEQQQQHAIQSNPNQADASLPVWLWLSVCLSVCVAVCTALHCTAALRCASSHGHHAHCTNTDGTLCSADLTMPWLALGPSGEWHGSWAGLGWEGRLAGTGVCARAGAGSGSNRLISVEGTSGQVPVDHRTGEWERVGTMKHNGDVEMGKKGRGKRKGDCRRERGGWV